MPQLSTKLSCIPGSVSTLTLCSHWLGLIVPTILGTFCIQDKPHRTVAGGKGA